MKAPQSVQQLVGHGSRNPTGLLHDGESAAARSTPRISETLCTSTWRYWHDRRDVTLLLESGQPRRAQLVVGSSVPGCRASTLDNVQTEATMNHRGNPDSV